MIFAYPYPEQTGVNKTFIFHAAKDWNSLPNDLKECNILSIFKSKLKTFLKDILRDRHVSLIKDIHRKTKKSSRFCSVDPHIVIDPI